MIPFRYFILFISYNKVLNFKPYKSFGCSASSILPPHTINSATTKTHATIKPVPSAMIAPSRSNSGRASIHARHRKTMPIIRIYMLLEPVRSSPIMISTRLPAIATSAVSVAVISPVTNTEPVVRVIFSSDAGSPRVLATAMCPYSCRMVDAPHPNIRQIVPQSAESIATFVF